eukprot:m.33653 g.33653  ORF g.33653 m.33653 type:complete len:734 (+) comp8580_c0_seq2:184-2385(+)
MRASRSMCKTNGPRVARASHKTQLQSANMPSKERRRATLGKGPKAPASKHTTLPKRKESKRQPTSSDGHDFECTVCEEGGRLLLCDYPGCSRVYHLKCLDPPLARTPKEEWHCPRCEKLKTAVHRTRHATGARAAPSFAPFARLDPMSPNTAKKNITQKRSPLPSAVQKRGKKQLQKRPAGRPKGRKNNKTLAKDKDKPVVESSESSSSEDSDYDDDYIPEPYDEQAKMEPVGELYLGMELDAVDGTDHWYPAEVKEMDSKENKVLVHFPGWSKRHDEWITIGSSKLRPRHKTESKDCIDPTTLHNNTSLSLRISLPNRPKQTEHKRKNKRKIRHSSPLSPNSLSSESDASLNKISTTKVATQPRRATSFGGESSTPKIAGRKRSKSDCVRRRGGLVDGGEVILDASLAPSKIQALEVKEICTPTFRRNAPRCEEEQVNNTVAEEAHPTSSSPSFPQLFMSPPQSSCLSPLSTSLPASWFESQFRDPTSYFNPYYPQMQHNSVEEVQQNIAQLQQNIMQQLQQSVVQNVHNVAQAMQQARAQQEPSHHPTATNAIATEPVELENIDDDSYAKRHYDLEQQERLRWTSVVSSGSTRPSKNAGNDTKPKEESEGVTLGLRNSFSYPDRWTTVKKFQPRTFPLDQQQIQSMEKKNKEKVAMTYGTSLEIKKRPKVEILPPKTAVLPEIDLDDSCTVTSVKSRSSEKSSCSFVVDTAAPDTQSENSLKVVFKLKASA